MRYTALATASLAALSLIACAAKHTSSTTDDDTTLLAEDGSDTTSTEDDTTSITTSLVAATGPRLGLASTTDLAGGTLVTENIGAAVSALYAPQSCLVASEDTAGSTATYTFVDCTGPHGLLHLSGTITVKFSSPSATELVLDITGNNLSVNRATVDWSAHADITASGSSRHMVWSGQFSGVTGRGRDFQRQSQKTVDWSIAEDCVTVNGTADGNVTGRDLQTTIVSYQRCRGACPEAGSEIKVVNESTGASVDLTYGTDTVTYTAGSASVTFTPWCALL